MNERVDDRLVPGIKRPYYPLPVFNPAGCQCYEISIPSGDEYRELLVTVLKSLTLWYNYQRDASHRGKVIADFFRDCLALPELGCDMNCEELTACLQPFFDAQALAAAAAQQTLDTMALRVQTAMTANAAKGVSVPIACENADNIYSGVLGVITKMYEDNLKLYQEAENSAADNAQEWAAVISAAIPSFAGLPFALLFELADSHHNTQAVDFSDGYTQSFIDAAAEKLYCLIEANNCTLSHNVIGDWLDGLDVLIPANSTAAIFARYAPVRQTLLNQIAALLNSTSSLDTYFNEIATAYQFAAQSTITLPITIDCTPLSSGCETFDLFNSDFGFEITGGYGAWVDGVGFNSNNTSVLWLSLQWTTATKINSVRFVTTGDIPSSHQIAINPTLDSFIQGGNDGDNDFTYDLSANVAYESINNIVLRCTIDGLAVWDGVLRTLEICWQGNTPEWASE